MDKFSKEYQESQDICLNGGKNIERFLEIMKRLRDKEHGCPWDLEQNYLSLAPHVIEEAYEVVDAIESGDLIHLESELGDLLLQIVFLAQLGNEEGKFDFNSVVKGISDKMIRMHPHVFADDMGIRTSEEQVENWENLKQKANEGKTSNGSRSNKNWNLPALILAKKWYQSNCPGLNKQLEMQDSVNQLKNLMEELSPTSSTVEDSNKNLQRIGEILYCMVKISRCLSVDPETALRDTIKAKAELLPEESGLQ